MRGKCPNCRKETTIPFVEGALSVVTDCEHCGEPFEGIRPSDPNTLPVVFQVMDERGLALSGPWVVPDLLCPSCEHPLNAGGTPEDARRGMITVECPDCKAVLTIRITDENGQSLGKAN